MLPVAAIRKAAISAPVSGCAALPSLAASAAPMITIDSPIAIRMKPWHRSAKWPPSMVHSAVLARPRPGV